MSGKALPGANHKPLSANSSLNQTPRETKKSRLVVDWSAAEHMRFQQAALTHGMKIREFMLHVWDFYEKNSAGEAPQSSKDKGRALL